MLAARVLDIGYESVPTSATEEALRLVKSGKCLLVLADMRMPGWMGTSFWTARSMPILARVSM